MVVFTGLSGSGKSSLAFDTLFAEGQRRYVESLSAYARQFLGQMDKPDVDFIEGLSPAVSIDQKTTNRNPRSTVGTITESTITCDCSSPAPASLTALNAASPSPPRPRSSIVRPRCSATPERTRFQILSPVVKRRRRVRGHDRAAALRRLRPRAHRTAR